VNDTTTKDGLFPSCGFDLSNRAVIRSLPQLPISNATARSWIIRLGMKYRNLTGRGYFDGHERPDVVKWREHHLERHHKYLKSNALFMYLTPAQAKVEGLTDEEVTACTVVIQGMEYVEIEKDFYMWLFHKKDELTSQPKYPPSRKFDAPSGDRPTILLYQDESIYKSYDKHKYGWSLKHFVPRISKKGEGPGIMVSGMISEDGWLTLTVAEMAAVNHKRALADREPIKMMHKVDGVFHSFHFFEYGANRDGYWNHEHIQEQAEEILDICEHIWGEAVKVIFYFDWSSGHAKMPDTAWNPSEMNLNYGGQQCAGARESTVLLEDYPKMKKGEVQYLFFQPEGPGPFYAKPGTNPETYVGKPKGLKQLLWERGLWKDGMTLDGWRQVRGQRLKCQDLSARKVMKGCLDIMFEKSELQLMIESRGHICEFLPKFHCELNPIERVWGRSKQLVRDLCEDDYKTMLDTVVRSLMPDWLPRELISAYFRKSRDYFRVYRDGINGPEAERAVKLYKSHRRLPPSEENVGNQKLKPWDAKKAVLSMLGLASNEPINIIQPSRKA